LSVLSLFKDLRGPPGLKIFFAPFPGQSASLAVAGGPATRRCSWAPGRRMGLKPFITRHHSNYLHFLQYFFHNSEKILEKRTIGGGDRMLSRGAFRRNRHREFGAGLDEPGALAESPSGDGRPSSGRPFGRGERGRAPNPDEEHSRRFASCASSFQSGALIAPARRDSPRSPKGAATLPAVRTDDV
jgi:hypothetical protein